MNELNIFGSSNIGMSRKINQDRFKFNITDDNTGWVIVCDGMGGPNGGEKAAQIAVDSFEYNFQRQYHCEMDNAQIKNLISVSLNLANIRIIKAAQEDESLTGMGTTAVACIIKNNVAHIMHAGDSRAYAINAQITQLTKDHSMVQVLVDQGDLTPEQARLHPEKNLITNALGINDDLSCEYTEYDISKNEMLLICTDGLTNCVVDDEIKSIIQKNDNLKASVANLIEVANANGGKDNITAVIIKA